MHRPVGDTGHIAVDLDFDTVEAATAFRDFLDFLTTFVWGSPCAPALAGTPRQAVSRLWRRFWEVHRTEARQCLSPILEAQWARPRSREWRGVEVFGSLVNTAPPGSAIATTIASIADPCWASARRAPARRARCWGRSSTMSQVLRNRLMLASKTSTI
ncbi:MAG: hypothetical protein H6512_01160 [Acidimicrobiia bacterium]|nr:hypothetical protein [Acidimicrobiia bacterium]